MVISASGKGWHSECPKAGEPGSFSDRAAEISFEMAVSLQHKLFVSCNGMQLGVHKDPFFYVSLYLV